MIIKLEHEGSVKEFSVAEFVAFLDSKGYIINNKGEVVQNKGVLNIPLLGFQVTGAQFAEQTNGRCLIADEPGLGKTAQSIAFAELHKTHTLIICPLSVVLNWKREIERFTGNEVTIWNTKGASGDLKNSYHICHYDAAHRITSQLIEQKFDLLICDEATYLKNRKTLRAKSILGSWKERKEYPGIKTKYCILLTGTPVMNRPSDLFTLLNFLDKDRFNNFYNFVDRYGGWREEPPKNLKELHDRTKDLIIRRKKADVFKDLPRKQQNELYVELDYESKREYTKLLQEVFGMWRVSRKPSVQHMPAIESFLAESKITRVREMIEEYLENDRSLLIYSRYLKPLKELHQLYPSDSVVVMGEMNKEDRKESIDALSSGAAKIGLFSLKAASMGIDGLQHSIDSVVFLDMDWTVASHEQAEDRTHRIGQLNQVQVYYMICDGTTDEYMRDILRDKQQMIDVIVDGEVNDAVVNTSFFKDFVARLKQEYSDDMSFEIELDG